MNEPEHRETERPSARYRRILSTGRNTERTIFFSDAVMAIAMTLLVLQIAIPQVAPKHLLSALAGESDALFAYVVAFVLIATNWLSHHRKFVVIARYDAGLQVINLGFLFFIAVLPLPALFTGDRDVQLVRDHSRDGGRRALATPVGATRHRAARGLNRSPPTIKMYWSAFYSLPCVRCDTQAEGNPMSYVSTVR